MVVQHHVVGARHAHHVIAPCGGQKQQEIIGGVLVRVGVIGVTHIHAHRQTEQLANEVILQPSAGNLPLVREVLRADEPDHRVHQERVESARDGVRAGFERELIDAVVGLGRERAPLPRLEVHHLVADPLHVAFAMRFEHALAALLEHR